MNYIDYYDNNKIENDSNNDSKNILVFNSNSNSNSNNNNNNSNSNSNINFIHHNHHNNNNQCNKKLYTDIYIDNDNYNNKMSINISTSSNNISNNSSSNSSNNNNSNKNLKKTFITKFGFRSIVIFLVFVPYIFILNYAIFPWMEMVSPTKGRIHSIVSMFLAIQILSNYYLTSSVDPGSFKDTTSPSYYLAHPVSPDYEEKFCSKCNEQKPERAHHCRYCNRCVLKLDHHCQWINNCVGFFNQKYFVLFLFYTSISIVYFFFLLFNRTIELITKHSMERTLPDFDLVQLLLLGFLIIILIIAGIAIVALLSTQVYLISKNLTTIEHENRKRKHLQPNSSTLYKKYDKGSIISNFTVVFGNDRLIWWFLPTPPNLLHQREYNKRGDIFVV